jgi:hypothetical protein
LFGQLPLQIRSRRSLSVHLIFQLAHFALLKLDLGFEFRNLFALDFYERLQAARVGIAAVVGAFPWSGFVVGERGKGEQ